MRRLILALLVAGLMPVFAADPAPAAPPDVAFVLKDKSSVRGAIIAFKDGIYEVKTKAMGVVRIPVAEIAQIDFEPDAAKAPPVERTPLSGDLQTQANALFGFDEVFQTLASDPALMTKIQALADDPEIAALVNDPEIQQAIERGDFLGLSRNRKLWSLMEHEKVKEITRSLTAQQAAKGEALADPLE